MTHLFHSIEDCIYVWELFDVFTHVFISKAFWLTFSFFYLSRSSYADMLHDKDRVSVRCPVRQGLKSSFPLIYNNITVTFSFLLEYKVLPGHPGSGEQGERQRTESLGSWHWHWHRSLVHDGSYCRCWLLLCYWGKPYCLGMCSVFYRGRSLGPWVFLVCWQTHAKHVTTRRDESDRISFSGSFCSVLKQWISDLAISLSEEL